MRADLQLLGMQLSACIDMAKGCLGGEGGQYTVTLICRSRFSPAHILIGDEDTKAVVKVCEELDRYGGNAAETSDEPDATGTPGDQLVALLRECGEQFRTYQRHHAAQAAQFVTLGACPERDARLEKAEVNRALADRIEALLAVVDPPKPEVVRNLQINDGGDNGS